MAELKYYVTPDDLREFSGNERIYKAVLCALVFSYIRYWEKENYKKGRPFYVFDRGSLAKRFNISEEFLTEMMRTLTNVLQLGRWLSAKECRWVKTVTKSGHKRVWVSYDHLYCTLEYDDKGNIKMGD